MANEPPDYLREIAELKARADWYRQWADLAGSGDEREHRLGLAKLFEAKARALWGRGERME
jgi:hypothetical protein